MTGWIILVLLVTIALVAPRYGADSRTGDSWTAGGGAQPPPAQRANLRADLAAAARALARAWDRLRH